MEITNRHPVEGGVLRNVLALVIDKIFSNHMKRLVFISSVVGLIYRVKNPDLHLIHKLNAIFKLAEYPEAMQLPFRVKSVIWKNKDLNVLGQNGRVLHIFDVPNVEMNQTDIERLSSQVVSQTPWCLQYSNTDDMRKDLRKLFQQIQRTRHQPAFQ